MIQIFKKFLYPILSLFVNNKDTKKTDIKKSKKKDEPDDIYPMW